MALRSHGRGEGRKTANAEKKCSRRRVVTPVAARFAPPHSAPRDEPSSNSVSHRYSCNTYRQNQSSWDNWGLGFTGAASMDRPAKPRTLRSQAVQLERLREASPSV